MQKEALTSIFGKQVRAGQTVTVAEVKERTKNHPILSVSTTKDSCLKQVVNFVNYQAKTSSVQGSPPSTIAPVQTRVTDWLNQVSDHPTRTSARRLQWDVEDVKLLSKAFKKHPTLPTTGGIRKILASDSALKALLDQEGWTRVYNKLKNTYRAKK